MPDWMNQADLGMLTDKKFWEALPLPDVGPVPPGMSLERAIAVSNHMLMYA
jgi:hypothetical protein